MSDFKITLKAARVNAGLTMEQAAQSVGRCAITISSWESGKTAPTLNEFKTLCSVYGCPESVIRLRANTT